LYLSSQIREKTGTDKINSTEENKLKKIAQEKELSLALKAIKALEYKTKVIAEINENKKKVIADTEQKKQVSIINLETPTVPYLFKTKENNKVNYISKSWILSPPSTLGEGIKGRARGGATQYRLVPRIKINLNFSSPFNHLFFSYPKQTSTIIPKEIYSSSLIKGKESNLNIIEQDLLKNTHNEKVIREKANLIKLLQKGDLLIKELNLLINLLEEKKNNFCLSSSHSNLTSTLNKKRDTFKGEEKENLLPSLPLGGEAKIGQIKGSKPILNQYLKTMSTYNMRKKGILITYNNQIEYSFLVGNLVYNNKIISKIYKLLQASFKSMYCLISKPVFVITPDKITIRLFYFLFIPNILKFKKLNGFNKSVFNINNGEKEKKIKLIKKQYNKFRKIKKNIKIKLRNLSNITLIKVFSDKFKILSSILSKMFKKPVEFDLIRLHYPYNDSNILVNLLGIMVNKIKLRVIIRRLYEKAVIKNLSKKHSLNSINIPAFLSGIKIKVGGRLLTQSVVPKKTVKVVQRGAIQRGKINFLDVARYTNKNKRGAFSITVKSGQNII
jgi:hypothetical protein